MGADLENRLEAFLGCSEPGYQRVYKSVQVLCRSGRQDEREHY